jgi:hypothetical protein
MLQTQIKGCLSWLTISVTRSPRFGRRRTARLLDSARAKVSRAHYYNLKKQRKGPREAHAGSRVLITPEAERDWERDREAEAARLQHR